VEIFCGKGSSTAGLHVYATRASIIPICPICRIHVAEITSLDCNANRGASGIDFTGPWIQGRPGQRFIYLSWIGVDSIGVVTMFRRAKLMLDAVDSSVADAAVDRGRLVARVGRTDARGRPLCAAVRPPLVAWSSGAAR
jgi:hypothetical protein